MPATEYHNSGGFLNMMRSMETTTSSSSSSSPSSQEQDLEAFHRRIAEGFLNLNSEQEELMSLRWLRSLLDSFLSCQDDFRLLLAAGERPRPPADRMLADYFDRTVKALDVCNAVRDGIDQIRHWQRLVDIVLAALSPSSAALLLGEGQFRRARRALLDLSISMLDDASSSPAAIAHRNRSFGRNANNSSSSSSSSAGARHLRSLSWSVSRSWSAARQLQAMASGLAAPRGGDGVATAIFAANSVLVFTMWALVAAIPCQDRGGLQVHFPPAPRQLPWAAPMAALHDRIVDDSRRRDREHRRGTACGLLREIIGLERCSRALAELADSVQFPVGEDRAAEVRARLEELAAVCAGLREGLDPLERHVREVFHRIVLSRTQANFDRS